MANCIIEEQDLHDIANAIRTSYNLSSSVKFKPREMANGIINNHTSEETDIKNVLSTLATTNIENPTITNYLTQLTSDKTSLKNNLETKGITGLTDNDTFTTLVPKVLNIPSGLDWSAIDAVLLAPS